MLSHAYQAPFLCRCPEFPSNFRLLRLNGIRARPAANPWLITCGFRFANNSSILRTARFAAGLKSSAASPIPQSLATCLSPHRRPPRCPAHLDDSTHRRGNRTCAGASMHCGTGSASPPGASCTAWPPRTGRGAGQLLTELAGAGRRWPPFGTARGHR
jgi:hypothetical protein